MSNFATYPTLANKLVLITGGAQGIGAAAVEQFALQGARVVFLDLAEELADALIARLSPLAPRRPIYRSCDLTDITALQSTLNEIISAIGTPDVLVNNAASDDRHRFEDVTPAYWDQRIAVNLRHQYFAAQSVVPSMKAAGSGSIINMSSIAPLIPTPNLSIYNMAKSAVTAMTRSLAHELGPFNIRVNSVLPGAILTERQRRLYMSPEYEQYVFSVQHLKRHILPEEVARLILFLASEDSAAITSQSYIIDGGWI
jgi:NAD(P)-dependent dehydrogenase (short-subunit alcohol dehydrogenase family)